MPSKKLGEWKRGVRRAGLYLVAAAVLTASLVLEADPVAAASSLVVDADTGRIEMTLLPRSLSIVFLVVVVVVVLVGVLSMVGGFVDRCRGCGRWWAYEETDETNSEIEYTCKHCRDVQ